MFLFNIVVMDSITIPADGTGIYCNRTLSDLFAPVLIGNGVYCSQTIEGFFSSPLTGTGVYCSQDLSQL